MIEYEFHKLVQFLLQSSEVFCTLYIQMHLLGKNVSIQVEDSHKIL